MVYVRPSLSVWGMLRDGPFTPYWRVAIYGPWGTLKLQDWTLQDWTLTDDFTGVDIAGLDNGGPDIDGLDIRCNMRLLPQKPEVVTVSQHHRIFN